MKNSVEHILNRFGWKTVNGKVEYRGFEHKLNADLPDWRTTEPIDASTYPEPAPIPVEVAPEVAAALKKAQASHSELLEAQKRVDKLKARAKELKK